MPRPTLELRKDLTRAIRSGHPWLFDRAVRTPKRRFSHGAVVDVMWRGAGVATGLYDPDSPLRVRILETEAGAACDDEWARQQATRAARLRCGQPDLDEVDAFRVIHGENDFMPGLVLDVYARTGVMVADSDACRAFWQPRMPAVLAGCADAGVGIDRVWLRQRRKTGRILTGDAPPAVIEVVEGAARFEVDVRRGQKTGLFLDQRDNRRRIGALADGADVLNLFGYTGGFSIFAGLGGARSVVTVDSAKPAAEAAVRNWRRNELPEAAHEVVCGDVFDYLERCAVLGRRFGLVVCDPPSFVSSARARQPGLAAYERLNALAIGVVEPGGLLLTASCSSHVSAQDLRSTVASAAADTGRWARVVGEWGGAVDHPTRVGFPEGRYLSALLVELS